MFYTAYGNMLNFIKRVGGELFLTSVLVSQDRTAAVKKKNLISKHKVHKFSRNNENFTSTTPLWQ